MAIKLITIDMDGTLLNPHHQVTPLVKEAIANARKKGVLVVIVTGRPYPGVKPYLKELDMLGDNDYAIPYNGALVQKVTEAEPMAQESLDFDDYLYFEKMARELGAHFHCFVGGELYTSNKDISRYTVEESFLNDIPLKYRTVTQMDPASRFAKFMMIDDAEILDRAISQVPVEAYERYTLIKSTNYFFEILNKNANKGIAVKMLAEKLGINQDEIMAIGDQANDHSMIEYAGVGVAMGNAIPELKAISQFITSSNGEDGVAYAINKYVNDIE